MATLAGNEATQRDIDCFDSQVLKILTDGKRIVMNLDEICVELKSRGIPFESEDLSRA